MNDGAPSITDSDVQSIIIEADACERTVMRKLLGLPVRGRSGARVDRVLAARGFARSGNSNPPPRAA